MVMATVRTHVDGSGLEWWQVLAFGLGLALLGALYQWLRHRRNAPHYEALAERYGGTYAAKAQARTETFAGTGWNPRTNPFGVDDYLTGNHLGRRFYCFGWEYLPQEIIGDGDVGVVSEGDEPLSVHMSVYVMELPGYYGHFSVRRHSAVRRMFGQNDVQIGHPEFDKYFTVRAADPQAAVYALQGALPQFLLSDERSKNCSLWFMGDRLVCAYKSRFNPNDVEPALEYLNRVIGQLVPAAYAAQPQRGLWDDVIPLAG